jgi:hypothetical protein
MDAPAPLRLAVALTACVASAAVCLAEPSPSTLDLRVTDADLSPAVTLREDANRTTEEYRINGNLYMVKISPSVGAPYYLVDQDGSGDMALHRGGSDVDINIPQWALLSW